MTKSETRELAKIQAMQELGMHDTAARSLSALIRATLNSKTAQELKQRAIDTGLIFHPDFIV